MPHETARANAPFRPVRLADPTVTVETRADGSILLRSADPLGTFETQIGDLLRRQADLRPDTVFLAEREGGDGWRTLTYGAARQQADAISQALLGRGLSAEHPVMILSGNGIDHALLVLGAMQVGIPAAPVSPAYSRLAGTSGADFGKVEAIRDLVRPGLVFAGDAAAFVGVLGGVDFGDAAIVTGDAFADLLATAPGPAVERAYAAVTPDHAAKYLFTSGSTGVPKGVVNTQRMLCANQQMNVQQYPFVADTPPVIVDWLPWNHTFGGNFVFNLVLKSGGTLYIDDGNPRPDLVARTVRNLAEISPTIYFSVPAGYAALLAPMARDAALRRRFFDRLALLFHAGAALPRETWQAWQALAVEETGSRIVMATGYGSTESAPAIVGTHWPLERAGTIGIPSPGATVKLVPVDDGTPNKYEIRGGGPGITPGYLGRPDLGDDAFDAEGFFRFGDAVALADPADPAAGLIFAGRLTEEFKLATGTWVAAGALRPEIVGMVLRDAVICGHDRAFVAILAWPDAEGCRRIAGAAPETPVAALLAHPAVRNHIARALAAHNAANPGSSRQVRRLLLHEAPPDPAAHEITDKGYINQRMTLQNRAGEVSRLFAATPDADVIVVA
jgi:feruloyl-CoA synthase